MSKIHHGQQSRNSKRVLAVLSHPTAINSLTSLLPRNLRRMCRFAMCYYKPTFSHVDLTSASSLPRLCPRLVDRFGPFWTTKCTQARRCSDHVCHKRCLHEATKLLIFPFFVAFVRFTHETQDRLRRRGSWPFTPTSKPSSSCLLTHPSAARDD